MQSLADYINKRGEREEALIAKYGPDFNKPVRTIEVNKAEEAVIQQWAKSLEQEISEIMGDEFAYPHITYSFTATGLGYILVVKEAITKKELNVSQALDWHFYG